MRPHLFAKLGLAALISSVSLLGVSIPSPDAAYTSSTTLAAIPYPDGTNLASLGIFPGFQILTFDQTMQAATLGAGWGSWNSPPEAEVNDPGTAPRIVFAIDTSASTGAISLSQPAVTFGFELQPNQAVSTTATVDFRLGTTIVESITRSVDGSGGSKLFARTGSPIDNVVITMGASTGFGLAQFRYALPQPATLTKIFTPVPVPFGERTTLAFSLQNPNPYALTNVLFEDAFSGLVVANPNGVLSLCDGAIVLVDPGDSEIAVLVGSLPANLLCYIFVDVVGTGEILGEIVNTTSPVTATNAPIGDAATDTITITSADAFQVRYVANLNVADSLVNITNTGFNGAMPFGPGIGPQAGNICINVYAFTPDEQMAGCCSCHLTPNALASLSVYNDIRAVTLTGLTPNSMVIKLVATATGGTSTAPVFSGGDSACGQSAAGIGTTHPMARGLAAWATTGHVPGLFPAPGAPAPFAITETAFVPASLSAAEIASLNNRCTAIIGNGSTFGTCRSCTPGGRGVEKF